MDWYSWLSKTSLDPTLVHDYAPAFVRNQLQEEDLTFFNHEFLQSIGISIAKHRLEILKLARKEERRRSMKGFSTRLVLAMNKTRKLFTISIGKWGHSHQKSSRRLSSPYRNQWSGALMRRASTGDANRKVMWSGPLDGRMVQQDKFMMMTSHSVSGPLDGKTMQERITWSPMVGRSGFVCRSPTVSGPIERLGLSPKLNYYSTEKLPGDGDGDDGVQSLWSLMFQDMKPT